ncbi:MAG: M42 family metallopeptidase [Anaerolineales bacterium]
MKNLPDFSMERLVATLVELLEIPSPTGSTSRAVDYVHSKLVNLNIEPQITRKGVLTATLEGESSDRARGLTAHLDTLGAMVREVKDNGRLKLTPIGGFAWNTVEGEGCTVFTQDGKAIRGSLLLTRASGHIFGEQVGSTERDEDTLEVRLDERTDTSGETLELGIQVGDFVAFDPRVELGPSGFIRSRHLDDKAGAACLLAAAEALQAAELKPAQTTTLHFSNFEEVGHGAASGFPPDLAELVAVDMAVVGPGQASDEFHVTICVKDSRGPYHQGLSNRLRSLADEAGIPYRVDTYPYYGSDGEAYWRAGGDVALALIGPGVDASHNYERTHREALEGTTRLILAYLLAP